MTILISVWYTKKEQLLRSAITFTSFSAVISCPPYAYQATRVDRSSSFLVLLLMELGKAVLQLLLGGCCSSPLVV
jgi:hypothetical protein